MTLWAPILSLTAATLAGFAIAIRSRRGAFLAVLPCPTCGLAFGVKAADAARDTFVAASERTKRSHPRSRLNMPTVWPVICPSCLTRSEFDVETRKLRPALSQLGDSIVTSIMLDEAFNYACQSRGVDGHRRAKERLHERFPRASAAKIAEIFLMACRLHEVAFIVADHHLKDEEAIKGLRETIPGFAPATYVKALRYAKADNQA